MRRRTAQRARLLPGIWQTAGARRRARLQGSASPRAQPGKGQQLPAPLGAASGPMRGGPGWGWEPSLCPQGPCRLKRKPARPAAHLWVASGSHHSAKGGDHRIPHSGPEAPAPGARGFCGAAEGLGSGPGPGSGSPGPHPATPHLGDPPPPPPSPVPYLGPGLGSQKERELACPAAHGLRPVGVHKQHQERGGIQLADAAGEPVTAPGPRSPAPGRLHALRPAWRRRGRCAPGGRGRCLPKRRAEWAAPPSGAYCSLHPALASPDKPEILKLACRLPSPGALRKLPKSRPHTVSGRWNLSISIVFEVGQLISTYIRVENHRYKRPFFIEVRGAVVPAPQYLETPWGAFKSREAGPHPRPIQPESLGVGLAHQLFCKLRGCFTERPGWRTGSQRIRWFKDQSSAPPGPPSRLSLARGPEAWNLGKEGLEGLFLPGAALKKKKKRKAPRGILDSTKFDTPNTLRRLVQSL